MPRKLNILVFPCGSEIGLEIHRALRYSTHINLFGASSVDDHGRFVYNKYISNVPFFDNPTFIEVLNNLITEYKIDAVYPTMDGVIEHITENTNKIKCKVIGSPTETTKICLSKLRTYKKLRNIIPTPRVFENLESVDSFPVFLKPEIGYGSRGAKLISNIKQGRQHLYEFPNSIILEFLPGAEFTVDCFTNNQGKLLFIGGRERRRILNGISVNTIPILERKKEFESLAEKINEIIEFQGAWFFQVKENEDCELTLLEVACRLGGSSSLFRNLGVNFALLSIFDAFGYEVEIFKNENAIELDRAFSNRYKIDIDYDVVYVDFDDCILLSPKLNIELISFLYQCVNDQIKIVLLTKHEKDINESLRRLRLLTLFDEIIHITREDSKWKYIKNEKSIFIDDSFSERIEVFRRLNIPVFAPDSIESLIK